MTEPSDEQIREAFDRQYRNLAETGFSDDKHANIVRRIESLEEQLKLLISIVEQNGTAISMLSVRMDLNGLRTSP